MNENQFYKSRNNTYDTNTYSLCKVCVQRMGKESTRKFHGTLRILDIPFIPEIWSEAQTKDNPVGYYFVVVNNPRKKDVEGKLYSEMTYRDSPQVGQVEDVHDYVIADDERLQKLAGLFGEIWSAEQLIRMDEELDEMFVHYGSDRKDLSALDLYADLVLFKQLAITAYNDGDEKTGNDMTKLRNNLLKENGMTMRDMRERKNTESIGMKIDMAEDRPIVPQQKYYDVNGIRFMWDMLIRHMERFAGGNKTPVKEDYEEMQEFVDNNPHYSEEMK